ncbi:DoxX family protein [Kineococcus sp. NPDC059986]|uniref:DoxX family protein n=1 Tax=Kineococcus sp. NPDC059986 TaxID=3155538 RepID=UPI00344B58FA
MDTQNSSTQNPTPATDRAGALRLARTPSPLASTGLLVLRLVAGVLLLVHGVPKLEDPAMATGYAASLGVPAPTFLGWLMILGELGLGTLLVLGLATRVAGTLLLVQMSATWLLAHAPQGFLVDGQVNGENALLYAVLGLTFALTGAGLFSLDGLLVKRRR